MGTPLWHQSDRDIEIDARLSALEGARATDRELLRAVIADIEAAFPGKRLAEKLAERERYLAELDAP